ncbi:MAG: sensor histidine kinase [Flavobacteriaceae bacterium]|nr:sensor histidine kinase [Bacteroidia bacterium]NNL61838.1 sensor histidine kinase [Flavobacteriaceae bacterium]
MLKKYRNQIILLLAILIGALVVNSLLQSYYQSLERHHSTRLEKVHTDAVMKVQAGIEVYATIVSSLRAFLNNSKSFPTELEFQAFLMDLLKEIDFDDEIIVNYIDTDQEFQYVFNPFEIDPSGLKGKNAKDFRPTEEIEKLNELMNEDEITIFEPINLREGWAGLPFNFSAMNKEDEIFGYIATIIDLKYLLDYFYKSGKTEEFIHSFKVNNKIDITREVVYDGTTIYNENRDKNYYMNFNVDQEDFIFSNLKIHGLNMTLGSAFRSPPEISKSVAWATIIWYGLLSMFSMIALIQYIRNSRLMEELKYANKNIEIQNAELKKSIFKVQTLIKEVHHRVKNNMQMIGNLLTLQQDEYEDEKVIFALEQAKNRVQSMALVHEKLYGSTSLEDVNTKEYITQLIDFIDETVSNADIIPVKEINVSPELNFDSETMASLGLIINELITNSYKYAFKIGENNYLKFSVTKENDMYNLKYSDSGPGLPDDFDFETSESLGLQLIHILTDQLNGTVTYSKIGESTFNISFKEAEQLA